MLSKKKTPDDFIKDIDALVSNEKLDYIDAIMHYCDIHGLEIEVVASLVKQNPNLKSKVYSRCVELNLVKGSATLV